MAKVKAIDPTEFLRDPVPTGSFTYVNNSSWNLDRYPIKVSEKLVVSSSIDDGPLRPSAVILRSKKKGGVHTVLISGDEDGNLDLPNHFTDTHDYDKYPRMSFECLRQFYGEKAKLDAVLGRFFDNTLRIVDYSDDERKEITANQLEIVRKYNRTKQTKPLELKPPAAGFTYIESDYGKPYWHRPGSILLRDFGDNCTLLFSQDEDSYFGVELPKHVKTIADAFASLVPDELKGVAGFHRQGEWFLKPEEEMPAITDCLASLTLTSGTIELPVEHETSAKHTIFAHEIRVDSYGTVWAVNPKLTHSEEDHEEIDVNGIFSFHRNKAVRSFSVKGMD